MTHSTPLLTLDLTCEQAFELISNRLQSAGLQVMRTFDLHNTQSFADGCLCPHHGTAQCNCQMVVALVYGSSEPVTLILHGQDSRTWLSLAEQNEASRVVRQALEKSAGMEIV